MKRRDFIKVLGAGSCVTLVPSALSGCGSMQSTAGWKGPRPGVKDIRLLVLSYAILAPNPHNKQPWAIRFTGPLGFDLYVDNKRLLPETDPPFRQVHIGQGTFLEHLDLAARHHGHRAQMSYFPRGMYGNDVLEHKPVASIGLVRDPAVARDPLFDQIRSRQTNKRPYDDRPLSKQQLAALTRACPDSEYRLSLTDDATTRRELTRILTEAMKIEIAGTRRHAETIAMFRFSDEEMERQRDGFGVAQAGVTGFKKWFAETFLLSRESALPADSSFGKATVELTENQARSAPVFGWVASETNTRLDQVRVGRAYARLGLAATAASVVMHPMSQVIQEYVEMSKLRKKVQTLLKVPAGHTVQMLFRLGHADPVPPAPRRRVADLLV